ncbi:MAG: MlaD family protein [Flavobacteriales bacterium]|nr:MlaD family protein [Flavobacteriales bacterium]
MKYSNEIKVGILAIIALALLYYGFNYLRGEDIFNKQVVYYSVYDHVDGLTADNPVQMKGFSIGKVQDIYFDVNKPDKLVVSFIITNEKVKLREGMLARIVSLDLLGSKGIELDFDSALVDSTRLKMGNFFVYEVGDTLPSDNESSLQEAVNQQVLPLKNKAEELISEINDAVKIIKPMFGPKTQQKIYGSLDNINDAAQSFKEIANTTDHVIKESSGNIKKITTNLDQITANVKDYDAQLKEILDNMSEFTDSLNEVDLAGALKNAERALESLSEILERANSGDGTLGLLLNDDSLYINMDQAMLELDKLLEDIRVNPKRYLGPLGKKDKKKNKPQKKDRSGLRNDLND